MFGWLTHWLGRPGAALHGGAATPRLKTYSAQTGYVYQYRFLGLRQSRHQGADATEYVFDVAAGSESGMLVRVVLPAPSLAPNQTAWGRTLAGNERYAVAKIALFQAFDERPEPVAMRADVIVRPADAAGILARLGLG
jgi:hypothetical protein